MDESPFDLEMLANCWKSCDDLTVRPVTTAVWKRRLNPALLFDWLEPSERELFDLCTGCLFPIEMSSRPLFFGDNAVMPRFDSVTRDSEGVNTWFAKGLEFSGAFRATFARLFIACCWLAIRNR
jgi:hypothetical protein